VFRSFYYTLGKSIVSMNSDNFDFYKSQKGSFLSLWKFLIWKLLCNTRMSRTCASVSSKIVTASILSTIAHCKDRISSLTCSCVVTFSSNGHPFAKNVLYILFFFKENKDYSVKKIWIDWISRWMILSMFTYEGWLQLPFDQSHVLTGSTLLWTIGFHVTMFGEESIQKHIII
jgi:hypothetical protein